VVFPNVAAGDTVVYTIKRTSKPFFPGQFFSGGFFQRELAFEDAQINVTLPKAMAAHVEVHGVEHRVTEGEQTTTHSFLYRNPRPPMAEATGLSVWDTDPRFIISTFADYTAVAAAYRGLANEKAAVTPRIQALADDIAAGASDRREQAHRIYDWVSEHIRYVAVYLGNGGYVPQTVATLMADGTVSGRSITTASGPFGIRLRQLAASIEGRGPSQWAETYFKNLGWRGKASFQFDPPRRRPAPVYELSASFELEARPEFFEGKAFGPPEGIRMLVRPGEYLLGSWTLAKTAPTPCFSGHQVEELSLTLPPGRDIELLPRGKTIENPYLRYDSNWQHDGQVVTVRREITVKLPVAVCRDEIRTELAKAIAEIRGDYRAEIALKPLVQ